MRIAYLTYAPELYPLLQELCKPGMQLSLLQSNSDEERMRIIEDAEVVLVAETRFPGHMIDHCRCLRLIQHQGVGYEKIDLQRATEKTIPVCITPEGSTTGVAEHTILLILAVFKHLPTLHDSVRTGTWLMWALRDTSFELSGKTLGILGFGRIGRRVAQLSLAFGARVRFHHPRLLSPPSEFAGFDLQWRSFPALLQESDIVSNHLPSSPETVGLFSKDVFAQMKQGAIFINTSRGDAVDEPALAQALQSGHLLGAGVDVFAKEPPNVSCPLLHCGNVVLTPHVSAGTADAMKSKFSAVFDNFERLREGKPLLHVVGTSR